MSNESLKQDQQVYELIKQEQKRQFEYVNLIASENLASSAVLQASGTVFHNKYAEGYPAARYYGGCEYTDEIENLAKERASKLFGGDHINVQPHCGSSANMAAYSTLLNVGDKILTMSLDQGGHLTHGSKVSFSGQLYSPIHYHVSRDTERIDFDEVEILVEKEKPKLIVCGYSAYSRTIDFAKFSEIAKRYNIYLMADMAHISGLVAAGEHPSPVPYADIVTSTTHKTLRSARGGLAITKQEYAKSYDSAVFPRLQGGPLISLIAGKAVGFYEALQPSFKQYIHQVKQNASAMAKVFMERGIRVVSGGTDNHLFLVDLRNLGITGKQAVDTLHIAKIVVNKNAVPYDAKPPTQASGIRIGTPCITSRGMAKKDAITIAEYMVEALKQHNNRDKLEKIGTKIVEITKKFPIPTTI